MVYVVKVVDQDGSVFGTLDDAEVTQLSLELNGVGSATISLPTTDPGAGLMILGREIQIYYEGAADPLFWGPIVRPQAGLDKTTWRCPNLLWYFGRRFMGRADRQNQLTNGDFEDGETGWTFSGVTHSIDTTPPAGGPGGDALFLTGATTDHNTYATQTWDHGGVTPPGWPGDFMTIAAWVYIPSSAYVDGALGDRGLVGIHRDSAGNVVDVQIAPISDSTAQDAWIQLEVGLPAVRADESVEVRLYPPHGDAYFDLVTMTFMESLAFGDFITGTGADVTDIISGIVAYAQDPAVGKSDLNIGVGGDPTGVARLVAYQFAEHRNILDAILEYVRDGVCDISIETTATTRTFMVWPKSTDSRTPQLGKGDLYGTTLELDVNLSAFTLSSDLEQGASSVVLLGPGDGPDRPEGGATDTAYAGGAFTAEIVEQAPDDTSVGQLDDRAAERLKVAARPEILQVTTLPAAGIIGDLKEGDTAPIMIAYGWVDIPDVTYRVSRIEVDLNNDQATLILNAIP